MDDAALLRSFADHGDEHSLGVLIQRHMGFVYSVALRRVNGDTHHAQDVSQQVLADMGRKAKELSRHPALKAWLFTATRYAAGKLMIAEQRRRAREEAHSMNETHRQDAPPVEWDRLRPVLDEALDHLGNRDRRAVIQRFFEGLTFGQIGQSEGITEDGARLQVSRALGKMAAVMKRRGIESTAAGLALGLTGEATASVPPAVAEAVAKGTLGILRSAPAAGTVAGLLSAAGPGKAVLGISAALAMMAAVGWQQWSLERERARQLEGLEQQLDRDRSEVRSLLHQRAVGQASLQKLAPSSEEVLTSRVMALRDWFADNPAYALPEMRLLTDADWVGFAFEHPEIDAGGDLWPVASQLRTKAIVAGEDAVQAALMRYVSAGSNPPLTDPNQLLAYSSSLDADILARYSAFPDAHLMGPRYKDSPLGPVMVSHPTMESKPSANGSGAEGWQVISANTRMNNSRFIGDARPLSTWP
jgi:RNA polymerase sigma factor (sigma-70 family)